MLPKLVSIPLYVCHHTEVPMFILMELVPFFVSPILPFVVGLSLYDMVEKLLTKIVSVIIFKLVKQLNPHQNGVCHIIWCCSTYDESSISLHNSCMMKKHSKCHIVSDFLVLKIN